MIYCQLSPSLTLSTGNPLRLKDVAGVLGPENAGELSLPCPDTPGVWQLDALLIAKALQAAFPHEEITMLGADSCRIHREKTQRHGPVWLLRVICALLILTCGSALGLAWFHSDVDMPGAMESVYMLFTGQPISDERLITIPYILGIAIGSSVFHALFSRRAVSPMDIKLNAYRQDVESAEAKRVE